MRFLLGGDVRLQSRELSLSLSLGDLEQRLELLELLGATLIAHGRRAAWAKARGKRPEIVEVTTALVVLSFLVGRVKYLMVGKPSTPKRSQRGSPAAVQSTSAISTFWEPACSSASVSQEGFMLLQCPHQGARNLTNACTRAHSAVVTRALRCRCGEEASDGDDGIALQA